MARVGGLVVGELLSLNFFDQGELGQPQQTNQEEAGPLTRCNQSEGALRALGALCQSREQTEQLGLGAPKGLGDKLTVIASFLNR